MNWYKIAQENPKILFINRGLPGSGKSTLAKQLGQGGAVFSTDEFFMKEGRYVFNPSMLGTAHAWNLKRATEAMQKGITPIVIDNTNTTAKEIRPYAQAAAQYGYKVEMREPDTPWKFDVDELVKKNTHGVPRDAIERMLNRWQKDIKPEDLL